MKRLLIAFLFTGFSLLAAACLQSSGTDTGTVIKSGPVGNNLAATLSNNDGVLKHGDEEFYLSFKDSSGKPVEVGAVALNFHMPVMGTMPAMNNAATFTTTGTPGVYHGRVKLESAGDWQAQISYEGAAGKGKTSFTVTAR
jgi:hypothetical protein